MTPARQSTGGVSPSDSKLKARKAAGPVAPSVTWDIGTAYDLFASLFVLHNAEAIGLRRAWAAGVRNRLVPEHREFLQKIVPVVGVPVEWIRSLDGRRSVESVLAGLDTLPPEAVLESMVDTRLVESDVVQRVRNRGEYRQNDVDSLLADRSIGMAVPDDPQQATNILELFARNASSGDLLKDALDEYVTRFFKEEEMRIEPFLHDSLATAQKKANTADLVELVEDLSGGLRLEDLANVPRVMLIPSFWAGPLVLFETLPDDTHVILFSARPRHVSLIPGDPVPDSLVRALQAVSDQTRLRITRILAAQPRSQIESARELRLRPPTITHHLKILRMANLVRLTESTGGEKRYDIRETRLRELLGDLMSFTGIE